MDSFWFWSGLTVVLGRALAILWTSTTHRIFTLQGLSEYIPACFKWEVFCIRTSAVIIKPKGFLSKKKTS